MAAWVCPSCQKSRKRAFCGTCGTRAPEGNIVPIRSGFPEPVSREAGVQRCPHDHAELDSDGFCPSGNGFPLGRHCRFVCPICRSPLDWGGGCETCHGCTTGDRLDWTFPGDRYDCYDDKGQPIGDGRHWVKTDGPRKACTPAENKAGLRRVFDILANAPLLEKPTRADRRSRPF